MNASRLTRSNKMAISVLMAMCVAMKDGSTECVVSGRYEDPRAVSIAMGMLKKRDPEKHELVLRQSFSILVEDA